MPRKPSVPCAGTCGGLLWAGTTSLPPGKATCRPCRKERAQRACPICGALFTPAAGGARGPQQTCSRSCGRKIAARGKAETQREASRRRRARVAGVASETYDRTDLLDRDGAACGICDLTINQSLRYPDQLSLSIDHVIPLSAGGDDVFSNVRLAHFICNRVRGNTMPNLTPGTLREAAASGNRIRALTALRDHLTQTLEIAEPRETAALARQLTIVLEQIDQIQPAPKEATPYDRVAEQRNRRRAAAATGS